MSYDTWALIILLIVICIAFGVRLIIWAISQAPSEPHQEHRKANDA